MYPEKCRPGTYADEWALSSCIPCPAGKECAVDGTVVPLNCSMGTYRPASFNIDEAELSVFCIPCPQGTWSDKAGIAAENGCIDCDERYICPVEGMTRFSTVDQGCP